MKILHNKRSLGALVFAGTIAITFCQKSTAQDNLQADVEDLKSSVQQLFESQKKLENEIAELKKQIKSQPAARQRNDNLDNVAVNIEADPVLGSESAPLVIVEFSDYQCPYCKRHKTNTLPELIKNFVDTGKIKYVFKDLPLERIHKQAVAAAIAANCAGEQGQYWPMHDRLFENSKAKEPVAEHAAALSLDMPSFEACVNNPATEQEVRADLSDARALGIGGTPTFVVATPGPNGTVIGTKLIRGAASFKRFENEIEAASNALKQ